MSAEQHRTDVSGTTIVAVQGDLTRTEVDAVVNAANTQLQHGGGVAGALSRAGGPSIQRESDAWVAEHGELTPGTAAVTTAGDLPAQHLVHVAGPVYEEGQDNEGLLRQAVTAALDAASAEGARTAALPAISAGIYGYPQEEATAVIAHACVTWAQEHEQALDEIQLIGLDEAATADFAEGLRAATS